MSREIKKILNYTHHTINLMIDGGDSISLPKHGVVRAATARHFLEDLELHGTKIPVNKTKFGSVVGLPEKEEGTIIVVSGITAYALKGKRDDVYIVDELIRKDGVVIGAKNLAIYDNF